MIRSRRASLVGLVAGVSLALVMACAAGGKRSAAPQSGAAGPSDTTAPPSPSSLPGGPHAQIEELTKQIELSRDKLGLPAAPASMSPCPNNQCSPAPEAMSTHTDPSCHPGSSDVCSSTCTLSDSICDNASKICNLAKQLPGDTWAGDRCTSANASCHDAHDKCCTCTQ